MNTIQRIMKNTAFLLIGDIIAGFFIFVAIVYLARVLGPEGFGKINFAMACVIYFTLIANLGLPLFGTREIARQKDEIKDYVSSIITLRLCLALVGFALLFVMTFFLIKTVEVKQLLLLYGLALIPSALLLEWVFQGVERMEYIGLSRIVANLIYLILIVVVVKGSRQLRLIPCFQVIGELIASGLLLSIFVRNFGKLRFRFNFSYYKRLLKQAFPIGLSLIMAQIFYNIDSVMLGFMKGAAAVGYYNAAYKIIMLLIIVIGAYHNAIFPVISHYYKTSLELLRHLLLPTTKLMVTIAVPLAIGGTILARPIIRLFYGDGYDSGVIAFQLLIWAVFIVCINTVYSRGVLACNKEKWFLAGVSIPAGINLIANFILIPPLGLRGAALATVLAEASGFVVMYIGFKGITQIPFLNYIFKPLFASIVMLGFLYWGLNELGLNIFLLTGGGLLVYLSSIYLIKGITKDEIRLIRQAISESKLTAGLNEPL